MQVELEFGFRKADANNIPIISTNMVLKFLNTLESAVNKYYEKSEHRVDYVQVRKLVDICEVRCVLFSTSGAPVAKVAIKANEKKNELLEYTCNICAKQSYACEHIMTFIFWLHRKSTDSKSPVIHDFWGYESAEIKPNAACRVRDIVPCNEMRLVADMETAAVNETNGREFLEAILNDIEENGVRESILFRHCRDVVDEFDSILIHHVMLDSAYNFIEDPRSFNLHMDEQCKQGIFDRFAEESRNNYKSALWIEGQYMRLRCSLIHSISSRKDSIEDDHILVALFCKNRNHNIEERRQLKQHKRFILKQTEKLENKIYHECGLLLSDSYPYICASPDGITDDHIVEIKAPKTDEEFEKYLEGRETIAPKYMAQIQIQMYMANVTKALYCVLSPTFDINGALHYVWVQADMEFVASLLSAAEDFWKEVVFPHLAKIYLGKTIQ